MDLALLLVPALIDVFRQRPSIKGALAGLMPVVLWEAFSLVYYGFPFPNTAYAKLGTGIPRLELAEQGGMYFLSALAADPLTLTVLGGAFLWVVLERERRSALMVLGVALYLAYVLAIGGDFMAGRFLSAATFVAVLMLVHRMTSGGWMRAAAFGVVIVVGLAAPHPPILSGASAGLEEESLRDARGIADERAYYYPYTGLLRASRRTPLPSHPWARQGLKAREDGDRVVFRDSVGMFGYYAGPNVHVVDVYALTDPLLARLPARMDPNWRPGHFARAVPAGYAESLEESSNQLEEEGISRYYDKLRSITRGAFFSAERFRAMLGMNLGAYSDWIDVERYRYSGRERVELAALTLEKASVRNLGGSGLRIELGGRRYDAHIELGLDCDDRFQLRYFRANEPVATTEVPEICLGEVEIVPRTVAVPPRARSEGYDLLWVFPASGSRPYRLTYVHLLR
jgi:arabinofuranosyltransferase